MPPASAAQEFAAKHGQEVELAESLPHSEALRQQLDLLSRLAKGMEELQQGVAHALQPPAVATSAAPSPAAAAAAPSPTAEDEGGAAMAVSEADTSSSSEADAVSLAAGPGSEADGDAVMTDAQAMRPGAPAAPVPSRHASLIAVCRLVVAATPLATGPREAGDQLAALGSKPVPSVVREVVLQEDLKQLFGSTWTPGMYASFEKARSELGPAAVDGAAEAALATYAVGGLALCAAAAAARTPAEVETTLRELQRGECALWAALRQLVAVLDKSARSEQVRALVCVLRG
jgi:hypothetical protein